MYTLRLLLQIHSASHSAKALCPISELQADSVCLKSDFSGACSSRLGFLRITKITGEEKL